MKMLSVRRLHQIHLKSYYKSSDKTLAELEHETVNVASDVSEKKYL